MAVSTQAEQADELNHAKEEGGGLAVDLRVAEEEEETLTGRRVKDRS